MSDNWLTGKAAKWTDLDGETHAAVVRDIETVTDEHQRVILNVSEREELVDTRSERVEVVG